MLEEQRTFGTFWFLHRSLPSIETVRKEVELGVRTLCCSINIGGIRLNQVVLLAFVLKPFSVV